MGRVIREYPTSFHFDYQHVRIRDVIEHYILTKMKKTTLLFLMTLLLMLAIPLGTVADNYVRGDCNHDGSVNVADVSSIINYLLADVWPEQADAIETVTYTYNGIEINMVKVKGGTFYMGGSGADTTDALDNEYPAHLVTLSDYYICTTEVTQELWSAVMGANPSQYPYSSQNPVECVSWFNCQTFITTLNQLTGLNFRFPTEAEWEFAARGGNRSMGYQYSGSNNVMEVAWCPGNGSRQKPYPVARLAPNELGLYDMSGNVAEWCSDWYDAYSIEPQTNPQGPSEGTQRVVRGGAWGLTASWSHITWRRAQIMTLTNSCYGLRLAMSCD